jgi:hypothetical protein
MHTSNEEPADCTVNTTASNQASEMNGSPPDNSLVRLQLSCRRTSKRSQLVLVNLANLATSLDPPRNDRPRTLSDILDEAIRLANETFDYNIELEGSTQQELETADKASLTNPSCKGLDSRGGRPPQ